MRIEFTFLFYGIYAVYQRCTVNPLKKKRSLNGNPTRRPPARLIALYKVFKVSLKPFQRLVGCGATPHENSLGGERGGSPGKGLAECEARGSRVKDHCEKFFCAGDFIFSCLRGFAAIR